MLFLVENLKIKQHERKLTKLQSTAMAVFTDMVHLLLLKLAEKIHGACDLMSFSKPFSLPYGHMPQPVAKSVSAQFILNYSDFTVFNKVSNISNT